MRLDRWLVLAFSLVSAASAEIKYFKGEGKESPVEGSIRLLTWNLLGLPNERVAVRPWQDRVEGIADKIADEDADVVVLQESFEPGLSLGLYERLKARYAHFYLDLESSNTPLPSGIAVFARVPLERVRWTSHDDLMDGERASNMGTVDFLALDAEQKPAIHIAASHFQGSSNCEWRVGLTETGERFSYPEAREREARKALELLAEPEDVPAYLCGDLNVDRRSAEYNSSSLNDQVRTTLFDRMSPAQKMAPTNTNFWKHAQGIAKQFPHLSPRRIQALAIQYRALYEKQLSIYLKKHPMTLPLANFSPALWDDLEKKLSLRSEDDAMIWAYFKAAGARAIEAEKLLWVANKNPGIAPPVTIGRVLEIRALPIEESLDYVLGVNEAAVVTSIDIQTGYVDGNPKKTLSDHHPVVALLVPKKGS
jgi:endonuclease/exonuclease/phosphatase family metal-dependent hydrolase